MGHPFLFSILIVCGLLVVGLALRAGLHIFRVLFIPASVIAGAIGFGIFQILTRLDCCREAFKTISSEMGSWPTWLIAFVFAGLLIERPSENKTFAQAIKRGARSATLAWIIILGQILIGLIVYLTAVRPIDKSITPAFAQLLEVSWAGGHGSSAAMGEVYKSLDFPQGKDLAFFLATVGLIYGVLCGLLIVNIAIRRGWTRGGGAIRAVSGLENRKDSIPAAYAKTSAQVIDPFTLQIVILAVAFAVGYGLQQAFIAAARSIVDDKTIGFLANIPLFLFTLIGGWIVRQILTVLRLGELIDSLSMQRLLGVAMDFLIVAAISTMRVESLATFFVPIVLLIVLAAVWSWFTLLVLAPRLLPRAYWFELGLLNYGFSTANTPQGMMLLRIVDPDLQTGAAEDYAIAAPLSAPFVGGGVVTVAVMPVLLQRVPSSLMIAALVGLIVVLYLLGRQLARKD